MLRDHASRLAATAAAGAMLMAVSACGGSDKSGTTTDPTGATGASASAPAVTKVGLAYDIGGRGDQSFNDAAAAGLEKAKAELGITEIKDLEAGAGETGAQKEQRLRLLAQSGHNPVIAVGFAYSEAIKKVAAEFPDTKFAIVDDAAQGANISNLVFAEHEGSFLVGAAAAMKTKKEHIGFVGGVQVPLIKKFELGFTKGAQSIKPDIKIDVKYLSQPPEFSGFNDPAKGKTAAQGMYDSGADIVYQAAGGSGGGVFEAAKGAKAFAIGVDSDQALTADQGVRDVIMTSMIKKVDVAVYEFLKSVAEGTVKAGPTTYDLKAGGVDFSTTGGKIDDIKNKLDEYKQKIINGEIKVPAE